MLTDDEWDEVRPLLHYTPERLKSYREKHGGSLKEAMGGVTAEARQRYFEITGFRETNPHAIWHHYLSHYGPECKSCGHLLRTSEASYCANCGTRPKTIKSPTITL